MFKNLCENLNFYNEIQLIEELNKYNNIQKNKVDGYLSMSIKRRLKCDTFNFYLFI
jgi:hypothetical protein